MSGGPWWADLLFVDTRSSGVRPPLSVYTRSCPTAACVT